MSDNFIPIPFLKEGVRLLRVWFGDEANPDNGTPEIFFGDNMGKDVCIRTTVSPFPGLDVTVSILPYSGNCLMWVEGGDGTSFFDGDLVEGDKPLPLLELVEQAFDNAFLKARTG